MKITRRDKRQQIEVETIKRKNGIYRSAEKIAANVGKQQAKNGSQN